MQNIYKNQDIKIEINDVEISVLNIVVERFLRKIPKHSHGSRSYEMHYVSSGYGEVNIGSENYHITPNTLYITGPHIEHEQMPNETDPMVEYTIYFRLDESRNTIKKGKENLIAKFSETDFWFGTDTQDMLPILRQIFYEMEHKQSGYKELVKSLLIQCVVKLVRNYGKEALSVEHFSPKNLESSKSLIIEESFLYDFSTITLEILADRLSLSTRQTERFIKEYYGKSFRDKKREAKMSAAKQLLKDDKLNITAVADRLNYSSVQHFSHAFKQTYGVSPGKYKKEKPDTIHDISVH